MTSTRSLTDVAEYDDRKLVTLSFRPSLRMASAATVRLSVIAWLSAWYSSSAACAVTFSLGSRVSSSVVDA